MNNSFRKILIVVLAGTSLVYFSCKKEIVSTYPETPFNPFDTITYNEGGVPPIPIDSNTFLGIHQYIMSVKCAQPACHDGSFEPDYRTVQSAYSTLVYAPVIKNTIDSFYTYRVVPGDTAHSWLWYRLTTDDADLGQMPLYDVLLPAQRNKIRNWIMNGAEDIFGNSPAHPTYTPTFYGLVAYLPNLGDYRVDTIRGSFIYNPFAVPQNEDVEIWWGLYDDITLPPFFTYNKVRFSTDPFDFSGAAEVNLQLEVTPHYEYFYGTSLPFFTHCTVNTSSYNPGDIVYMRVYVKDEQPQVTEIPDDGSQYYIQTYCAFMIQ